MKKLIPLALLILGACNPAPSTPAPGAAATTAPSIAPSTGPSAVPMSASPSATPAAPEPIVLHARDVTIHGKTVRYEPEPHKNTVGYWTDATDWVSWDLEITTPGSYTVEVLQGCGAGSGGSEVEIIAGGNVGADQNLTFTVEDTGHFQNFITRAVGSFTFAQPGRYTLSVKPKTKPGVAVMDLRQVTLTPATE